MSVIGIGVNRRINISWKEREILIGELLAQECSWLGRVDLIRNSIAT
jgi:hypothetical protein